MRAELQDILQLHGLILPGKRTYRRVLDLWVAQPRLSCADRYHAVLVQRRKLPRHGDLRPGLRPRARPDPASTVARCWVSVSNSTGVGANRRLWIPAPDIALLQIHLTRCFVRRSYAAHNRRPVAAWPRRGSVVCRADRVRGRDRR